MSSSGQDTDTIQDLATRVEMLEGVNRAIEREQRSIRRNAMHLENVVATIWRATMGPIPPAPDPIPTPAPPPILDPAPRPRPPVPRPPATPTPEPIATPPATPKPPTEAKNRVSEAFNSLRGRLGW